MCIARQSNDDDIVRNENVITNLNIMLEQIVKDDCDATFSHSLLESICAELVMMIDSQSFLTDPQMRHHLRGALLRFEGLNVDESHEELVQAACHCHAHTLLCTHTHGSTRDGLAGGLL